MIKHSRKKITKKINRNPDMIFNSESVTNCAEPEGDVDSIHSLESLSICKKDPVDIQSKPDQLQKKRKSLRPDPCGQHLPDSHLAQISQQKDKMMDQPGKWEQFSCTNIYLIVLK